jgi:hypothetical protein
LVVKKKTKKPARKKGLLPTVHLLDANKEVKAIFVLDAKPMDLKTYEEWSRVMLSGQTNISFGVRKG